MNSKIFLLIILLIVALFGGMGYFGFVYYKNYNVQEQKLKSEQDLQIEKLRQEVEALKNKEPQTTKQTTVKEPQTTKNTTDNITAVIKQWRPRVAFLDCKVVFNGNNMGEQSGSGYVLGLDRESGKAIILTNYHVIDVAVNNLYGESMGVTTTATSCDIKVPGDNQFSTAQKEGGDSPFAVSKKEDFAIIDVAPTTYMRNIINNYGGQPCDKKAELGEKVLILGWPGIGDQTDVTVTDGIISGYEGNYYITSAKVEHGNSGGVAISVKNNCYLGIPTYAVSGSVESLARILNIRAIFP